MTIDQAYPTLTASSTEVSLRRVTPANIAEIITLQVRPEQEHIIPSNVQNLADAFVSGWPVTAYGIYSGTLAVGFIMYACFHRESSQHWTDNSYFIWRFMIDARYQGQGLGRSALKKVIADIRSLPAGKAEWIWLCYDATNPKAQRFYESCGLEEAPLRVPTDDPWLRLRI